MQRAIRARERHLSCFDMRTYRGRRVETEWGVTYVPVDPKTELPEYIVDAAAWSRDGTAEDAEAVRNWIEETQNINATYTQWHPREVTGHPARPLQGGGLEALRIIRDNYERACRALRAPPPRRVAIYMTIIN